MDNSDITYDRAKFDAVWRRVTSDSPDLSAGQPPPLWEADNNGTAPDDEAQLREFMDDESEDAQFYRALAARTSGEARRKLLNIASGERCHLKKLMTKFFILTGNTYTPAASCPYICSMSDALRMRYGAETDGAAAYETAAGNTSDTGLADTYKALAKDEKAHAAAIEGIIWDMMR